MYNLLCIPASLHLSSPAEHPCCDWTCSSGLSWIKLPSAGSRSVCEQNLHKKPIGSARPWLIPASGRQLAHTYYRSRRQGEGERRERGGGKKKRQNWHCTPTQWSLTPLACHALTNGVGPWVRTQSEAVNHLESDLITSLTHKKKKRKSCKEARQSWNKLIFKKLH